ncbi:hypothetical protein GN958_ATG08353 [Phytophthora infestans]|uniref:Uncharacterized protein n=1 Tax=Phytophthora infestans TaxID=4787 RepID=A0A8S9UNX5_PHYIN|nr:hypothetical protein GN958_ATG10798 [Phytophthora infestans]KAF4142440.1 hypothetical protein GN958_ATG08353 [Phytophthora infestans]
MTRGQRRRYTFQMETPSAHGRRRRDQNVDLNYMLVTLGITKDDTNDGEYLPDEEDKGVLSDCLVAHSAARTEHHLKEHAVTIDKGVEAVKAGEEVKMIQNSVGSDQHDVRYQKETEC